MNSINTKEMIKLFIDVEVDTEDLTPSSEDRTITLRLKEAGKLMGIEVLDHMIISGIEKDSYYSFKESGVM